MIKWYWTGRVATLVNFDGKEYVWTGIYGVQIKSVFIGIIIGDAK